MIRLYPPQQKMPSAMIPLLWTPLWRKSLGTDATSDELFILSSSSTRSIRLRYHVLQESYEWTSSFISKKIPSWVQAASRLRDHVHQESYEETSSFISKKVLLGYKPHPDYENMYSMSPTSGTSLWLANCKSFLQCLLPVQTHTRTPTPVHPTRHARSSTTR